MTESGAHISVDRDQSKEERAVTIRGSPEAVEKAKKQILAITNHRHTPANEGQSFFENHKASRHPWHRSSEDQSQTDLPNDQQTWKGVMLPPDENWDLGMPDRSTFYIKDSGESLKEIPKNGWDDPQEEGQGGSQQEYSSWDSEHTDAGTTKNVQCYKCSAYGHISRNCTSNRWDEPQAQHGSHQEYSRDSEHRDAGTTKNVQCFRCSEYGHVRTDCPNNRGNRDVTCYKCGNAGHISRNCTNNNSQKKEPIKPANQRMVDRYGPRPQQGSGQSG